MTDHLGLVRQIDSLYERVVTDPTTWTPTAAQDWLGELASPDLDRAVARELRRVVRACDRLARFWAHPPEGTVGEPDWRARVDVAAGAKAWRPVLEIAMHGLDSAPGEELYEEVKARFRVVNHQPWMEGVSYEEWWRGHRA